LEGKTTTILPTLTFGSILPDWIRKALGRVNLIDLKGSDPVGESLDKNKKVRIELNKRIQKPAKKAEKYLKKIKIVFFLTPISHFLKFKNLLNQDTLDFLNNLCRAREIF